MQKNIFWGLFYYIINIWDGGINLNNKIKTILISIILLILICIIVLFVIKNVNNEKDIINELDNLENIGDVEDANNVPTIDAKLGNDIRITQSYLLNYIIKKVGIWYMSR